MNLMRFEPSTLKMLSMPPNYQTTPEKNDKIKEEVAGSSLN